MGEGHQISPKCLHLARCCHITQCCREFSWWYQRSSCGLVIGFWVISLSWCNKMGAGAICGVASLWRPIAILPDLHHDILAHSWYSQIPLSRAPLTCGNLLVALAPWTPNFSDWSLAAAHMTEPVTHMCWSGQISPLVNSSQATWQPFNLSHWIEMHNTHLLGHVG